MLLHSPTALPDSRIMRRVAWLLRSGGGPVAFVTAGRGLAQAVVATRGAELPDWADELADAMIRSLMLVHMASRDAEDPDFRAQLALSAAALSVVRPQYARRCDEAVASWLGSGMDAQAGDCATEATRALFALWMDDRDAAAQAVSVLVSRSECGAGWALHDWTVARAQQHGPAREVECFHHLRLSLGDASARTAASVLVFATVVLWERLGVPRARALAWLDEIALGPTAAPARAAS